MWNESIITSFCLARSPMVSCPFREKWESGVWNQGIFTIIFCVYLHCPKEITTCSREGRKRGGDVVSADMQLWSGPQLLTGGEWQNNRSGTISFSSLPGGREERILIGEVGYEDDKGGVQRRTTTGICTAVVSFLSFREGGRQQGRISGGYRWRRQATTDWGKQWGYKWKLRKLTKMTLKQGKRKHFSP